MNARLEGLAAERKLEVDANVDDLLAAAVRTSRITTVGEDTGAEAQVRRIATHSHDVARDCNRIINAVPEGVGKAWFAHRLEAVGGSGDRDRVRVESAALLRIDGMVELIEQAATEWVHKQMDTFRVRIANTTGATRDAFSRVKEQTAKPEVVTIELRANERAATKDANGDDLPRYSGHLFADANGVYPILLNDWEQRVIKAELERPGFVGWYRNPGTATPASLRIAYQTDAGEWASLQPDFIVISRRSDGSLGASIVDPHGDYLADARGKLRALASFAEDHGDAFVRIESITEADDGSLHVLDLMDAAVRGEVMAFAGGKVTRLYQSEISRPYP